jgi:hypothetical protein
MTPQPPLEGSQRSQRLSCRSTQMKSLNRSDPGLRQLNGRSATLKQIHGSGNGDERLHPSMTVGQCKRVRNTKASSLTHTLLTQVDRPTRPLQDISVNCLVKKQQGRKHSSNSPASFSEPLPTDPASTAILWQQVRAGSLAGMIPPIPSNARRQVSRTTTRSRGGKPAPPPSTGTTSLSRGDKSVGSNTMTNTSTQGVTVKDPDFREKILTPRGIVITD